MESYLDEEQEDSFSNPLEVRQVRQTEQPHTVKPLTLLEEVAGVAGLEPAVSGVIGPKKIQKSQQLAHPKNHAES